MEGEDCGAVLLLPSIRPSFEARRALLSIPSRRVSLTSSDAICAPADSSSDTRFDLVFLSSVSAAPEGKEEKDNLVYDGTFSLK